MGMKAKSYENMLPIPQDWNLNGKLIFDMVYNPVNTKFIKKAMAEGSEIITGIDMLVNQAAYSFNIWFNAMPDTSNIRKMLINSI